MRQLLASYLCALPVHLAGGLGRASCSHDDVTTLLSSQRLHHDAAIGEINVPILLSRKYFINFHFSLQENSFPD